MIENLTIRIGNCTHNDTRLTLTPQSDSGIVEVTGFVRGPFSDFATTLTADFQLRPIVRHGLSHSSVETLVMEPCYWTPHLPFWYEIHLNLKMADGSYEETKLRTGMKRLDYEGRNLRLQCKRIVLRGLRSNLSDDKILEAAREYETALILQRPDDLTCELASRLGVPLLADLRGITEPWQEVCRKLDWYPAVCLVLLSVEQLAGIGEGWAWPQHSCVAAIVSANSKAADFSAIKHQVLAVKLAPGERPPAWLAKIEDPVIAISSGPDSSIEEARARCDRWQAELAPEFDLAGYFV